MTALLSVIAFWGAFNEMIFGYMQDAQYLNWMFPTEEWGRRVPWFITSTAIGALCIVLGSLVVPLNLKGNELCVMYFITNFIASTSYTNISLAFQTATIEIFSFNEERMEVEAWSVIWALLGVIAGTGYFVVALSDLNGTNMFPAGVVLALVTFIGMIGVPMMKSARVPAKKPDKGYFETMKECMKNKAFVIYCCAQFFDGMGAGLYSTFFTFYFQFVVGVTYEERSGLFFLAILTTLFAQIFMAPILGCFALNKPDAPLRPLFITFYVLNIILIPLLFYVAPDSTKTERLNVFFIFVALTRVLYSPRSFWSTAARDWAIDEDIQNNYKLGSVAQMRKEASYASCSRFFQNLGSAIGVSAFFYGMFNAGLNVEDCRPFDPKDGMDKFLVDSMTLQDTFDEGFEIPSCSGTAARHAYASQCCTTTSGMGNLIQAGAVNTTFLYKSFSECCYEQQRLTQPASVSSYVRNLYGIAMPVLHIWSLLFMILFPIYGPRLKALYIKQREQLEMRQKTKLKLTESNLEYESS